MPDAACDCGAPIKSDRWAWRGGIGGDAVFRVRCPDCSAAVVERVRTELGDVGGHEYCARRVPTLVAELVVSL